MTTALDLVEDDLVTLAETMRAWFALIASHQNYGRTDANDGEMLSAGCDHGGKCEYSGKH